MNEEQVLRLIETSQFIRAYEIILNELTENPKNNRAIEISKLLSSKIRKKCVELGSNKATEMAPIAYETEALLRVVIKLNGEGVYG